MQSIPKTDFFPLPRYALSIYLCICISMPSPVSPHLLNYSVHKILRFFPRKFNILPSLPRQHWAAIGCMKNYQPIGVTVHSHCVDGFEGLLKRCRRGRGCSKLWKNTIFPEHPVPNTRRYNCLVWFRFQIFNIQNQFLSKEGLKTYLNLNLNSF